jgi:hypothetical protein
MTNTTTIDEIDRTIEAMFETFAVAARCENKIAIQNWRDTYKPLSVEGREEFDPRKADDRRFITVHPRHVWTVYGSRKTNDFRIVPGSFRQGSPKVCVTLIPWEHDKEGMIVSVRDA